MHFDKDIRMTEHTGGLWALRASEVAGRMYRLMPNVGEPCSSKRRVICGAVTSILTYGAPIWNRALRYRKYVGMMALMQRRLALRICSAYRTICLDAIRVLSDVIPLELVVEEKVVIHEGLETDREVIRIQIIHKWQKK